LKFVTEMAGTLKVPAIFANSFLERYEEGFSYLSAIR